MLVRTGPATPALAGRFAHITFWALAGTGCLAAYLLGNTPSDLGAGRYLGALWLAIGALVGLLATATPLRRTAVGVGVALFAAMATVQLVREGTDERPNVVTDAEIEQLEAYARSMNVDHGLTGYWDANNVTWATRLRLRLLAVNECNQGFRFCPYPVHRVTTSYDAVRGERSMLVVDSRQPMVTGPAAGVSAGAARCRASTCDPPRPAW